MTKNGLGFNHLESLGIDRLEPFVPPTKPPTNVPEQPTDAEIVEAVKALGQARKAVLDDLRSRPKEPFVDGTHWYCYDDESGNDYDPCPLHRAEADAEYRVRMLAERTAGITYPDPEPESQHDGVATPDDR